tara:strand:- start:22420 stop:22827 length:408 start_codon:yes stop_codon:yes gene_type:complete
LDELASFADFLLQLFPFGAFGFATGFAGSFANITAATTLLVCFVTALGSCVSDAVTALDTADGVGVPRTFTDGHAFFVGCIFRHFASIEVAKTSPLAAVALGVALASAFFETLFSASLCVLCSKSQRCEHQQGDG